MQDTGEYIGVQEEYRWNTGEYIGVQMEYRRVHRSTGEYKWRAQRRRRQEKKEEEK